MTKINYTEANRLAWNEVAPIHARQNLAALIEGFKKPGYSCLDAIETQQLLNINITGKAVAQLCCNNGRELLSIKNMGAARCVGFDIADEFIEQAQQLVQTSHIDCEFLRTNIYDIPATYNKQFDLIYITIGAICWLPDLVALFDVIIRLLKPKGYLFIYDMHPILVMFQETDQNNPPSLTNSYFGTEPVIDTNGLDYYEHKKYEALPVYWFHHKMSDIITGCLQNNLAIKHFCEYEHDISGVFSHFQNVKTQLPLSYTLLAQLST